MKYFEEFLRRVKRKKVIETNTPSQLKKCLRLFDLTALGVGSTLGVGIYILSGQISKKEAGPGVVISFLIAAIASIFSGLSYAEFGARVPKAGSAYIYSYVCVGEFIAFIIGWSMLLSYGIGASSVAKGFTKNLNSITNGKADVFLENFPLVDDDIFEKNLDIISFLLIMVLTIILAFGVKESTIINNLLTMVNIGIVLFVFIAGGIYVNFENWNISMEELKNNYTNDCPLCTEENNCVSEEYDTVCGSGGFIPYGFSGIIRGAGTAFYGFVGFDVIATVGEEVINPKRDIPLSIILALMCVFISYFGVSSIVTLCLPYFLQDSDAPLPKVFETIGLNWAVIIIQVGAFFGLFASLIGALIPLPRVIWAMASDGLVFKFLSKVHLKFQTPIYATLISGSIAAIMAAIFNLESLVDLMSIGTLLGYTMVSTCILILRYLPSKEDISNSSNTNDTKWISLNSIFNTQRIKIPTYNSAKVAEFVTWTHGVLCIIISTILTTYTNNIIYGTIIVIALIGEFFICLILLLQPRSQEKLSFQVPFVPIFPLLSVFINCYLMVNLGTTTWIQFIIYICIGVVIYFTYGLRHSKADVQS